ncbi:hypothetical protein G443_004844 [Actinoalloteichus cyanogriseus DSM 43889]|uniref:Uncharacterized protein n=1 Tax=Actinoalloteichus caeruleus DSM 43889 TaxID=1120930 RepID=A0ABT1JQY1_ACTCY|nr:hypothetical protein [Actinoalloteichus caeruleus DSM 43889]
MVADRRTGSGRPLVDADTRHVSSMWSARVRRRTGVHSGSPGPTPSARRRMGRPPPVVVRPRESSALSRGECSELRPPRVIMAALPRDGSTTSSPHPTFTTFEWFQATHWR